MRNRPGKATALLPWLAFLIATVVADAFVDRTHLSWGGLVASAPFYLLFVALPSLAPIAVARSVGVRWTAVITTTVIAATSGALVVTTDDAQAGLAVLWVPFLALPLAALIGVSQSLASWVRACR